MDNEYFFEVGIRVNPWSHRMLQYKNGLEASKPKNILNNHTYYLGFP